MPRLSGLEFLKEIRQLDELKSAIVFVLTTSKAESDLRAAYRQCIAGYLLKDKMGRDFQELIKLIDHYSRMIEFPITTEPSG